MKSQAADVETYIAEADPDRREILAAIRSLCIEILPGYVEAIDYGMPTYKKGAKLLAFASQKNYISLYMMNEKIAAEHPDLLVGANYGKGCLRYTKPAKIDLARVRKLLEIHAARPD